MSCGFSGSAESCKTGKPGSPIVLLRLFYLALTGIVTFLRLLPMSSTDKEHRNLDTAPPTRRPAAPGQQAPFYPSRQSVPCRTASPIPPTDAAAALPDRLPRHHPALAPHPAPPPTCRRSRRSNPADHRRCAASEYSFSAWPTRARTGATAGSTANSPAWASQWRPPPCGRSSKKTASNPSVWPAVFVFRSVMDGRWMLLSMLYRLVRWLLGLTVVLVRRDLSQDAELWSYDTRTPCCGDRSPGSPTRLPIECG
jgi:hypothetical protein